MDLRTRTVATFRVVAAIGLTGIGMIHGAWACGSHWPAVGERELAEAAAGSADMPPKAASGVVAVLATGAGLVAGGVFGERKSAVWARRFVGAGLLARGLAGGVVAGRALGLPEPGERFRRLDARYYRPLCVILGSAAAAGSARPSTATGG